MLSILSQKSLEPYFLKNCVWYCRK